MSQVISKKSAQNYKSSTAYLVLQSALLGAYWPKEIETWAREIMSTEKRTGMEIIRSAIEKEVE